MVHLMVIVFDNLLLGKSEDTKFVIPNT